MKDVKIYVEGVADQVFLRDYISEIYNKQLSLGERQKKKHADINELGGKDEFLEKPHLLATLLQMDRDAGFNVAFIFDADGFEKRKEEFLKIQSDFKTQYQLDISFFLFPNHQQDGDLEVLLENIINPDNRVIFDCWNGYESCLKSNENKQRPDGKFTIPARKTKIQGYLEVLLGETKSERNKYKEASRDYREKSHWDLTHAYLTPLKSFLD